MRTIAVGLATAALMAARPVQASPFETVDLEVAQGWEVKVLTEVAGTPSSREVFGPALDLTAPLRPGIEAAVTFGRAWAREDGAAVSGFGDVEVAVKTELTHQRADGGGVSLTIEPAVLVPVGARGLSNDAWRLSVPLVGGRDVGRWSLRAMAAYARDLDRSANGEVTFSVLAMRQVSDHLRLGGELVWEAAVDEGRALGGNLGFSWEATEGVEVEARLGRTLVATLGREPETSFGLYLTKAF